MPAVSDLASVDRSFRFAVPLTLRDQNDMGRGAVGFDLADFDWGATERIAPVRRIVLPATCGRASSLPRNRPRRAVGCAHMMAERHPAPDGQARPAEVPGTGSGPGRVKWPRWLVPDIGSRPSPVSRRGGASRATPALWTTASR